MTARYQEIFVPLVIAHGTADRNVPIEQSHRLQQTA
jgi:dipeptidyl aminopeptidase/acylaminoacyl peptidase